MAVMRSTLNLPFRINDTKVFYIKSVSGGGPQTRAEPHCKVSVSNFASVLKRGNTLARAPEQCGLYACCLNELKVRYNQPPHEAL